MEAKPQMDLAGSEPLLAQANLARIRGQWNEAVEICVRVLRGHPGNADAHSLLGDIYRDQGTIDDAIQWYRMAADLRPNGPDVEKLRKLEAERERRAAQSGILPPLPGPGGVESASGGTTQLMGYSPKRWLNSLTIVSACFLAATILVLAVMRVNPPVRGNSLPRNMQLSSHPMMPTAETGVKLPPVNPNRPSILPVGEQPQTPIKIHQTGDGLEPDRPTSSRTVPLPTFSLQTPVGATAQNAPQNRELPPAPVQLVQPLNSSLTVAPAEGGSAQDRHATVQPRTGSMGVAGQTEGHGAVNEREPGSGADTTKPAPNNGAGEPVANGGGTPPER